MNFKNLILSIAVLGLIVFVAVPAHAQDEATESSTSDSNQVEDLKDRLASKVDELSETTTQAQFGVVKEISVSTITIEAATKAIRIELTDDITVAQYISGDRTDLSIEDVEVNDVVVVFGTHDETLDILKARQIFIQGNLPLHIVGTITEVNEDNFTVSVASQDGQEYVLDYERSTKSVIWNDEDQETEKGGFSKLSSGDTIHALGLMVEDAGEKRISAIRITSLGPLTGAKAEDSPTPEEEPAAEESSEETQDEPAKESTEDAQR